MNFDISIIIPFYNEEESVNKLLSELSKFFQKHEKITTEIIFVSDGSTDKTSSIIAKYKFSFCKARIIFLSRNFGSHAAIRAGIKESRGRYVTFISADLQDPTSLVYEMFETIEKGYDVIWAKRKTIHNSFFQNIGTKLYANLMRVFVCKDFPENGFDIAMFNGKIKNELNDQVESNSSIFIQIINLGFKSKIVFYEKNKRNYGKSKWTLAKKIKFLIDSFVSFSYVPIRFVTGIGILLSLGGFVWGGFVFFRAILTGNKTPGWPSLLAILTIGFGITNISLGIISEYLWRTYDAALKRKTYIIDKIQDL